MGRDSSQVERIALDKVEKEEKKDIEHPCKDCASRTIRGIRHCPLMEYAILISHCREVQKLSKIKAWLVILGGAKIVEAEK